MGDLGIIKKTIILFVAMTALSLGIGFALPDTFHVERTLVVDAPAEQVWRRVAHLDQWPNWDPWSRTDPQMTHTFEGEPGVGHLMRWTGPKSGIGRLETMASSPYESVLFHLVVEDQDLPRLLKFTFTDLGGKTQLTWSISGENGLKPIGNYFALGMDRYIGPMYEQGLSNLKSLVETGKLDVPEDSRQARPPAP